MKTIWKVCFLVSLMSGIISAPVIGAEQKQNKLPEQKQKVSEKKKPLKNGSGIAEGRENIRSETCNPQLLTERKSNIMENILTPKQRRRNQVLQVFKDYPDKIAPAIQEKILAEQIVPGMAPYDAYLAAGAFAFKVIADPAKWEKNADPYKVMWAQSVNPDGSQIWMTFENDTQYPLEGKQTFRVFFQGGKALEIEKLSK